MSYYWFNKKAEEKYHNCGGKAAEKNVAEYYQTIKDAIKEKAKNRYKNFSEGEKEKKGNIPKIATKN